MKKFLSVLLVSLMVLTMLGAAAEGEYPQLTGESGIYNAGVYEQKIRGMGGYMIIHVTFSANAIENIEVISHTETPNIGTLAIEQVIPAMIEAQSTEVDSVSGATITSNALKEAVNAAIEEAKAAGAALYVPGTYDVKLRGMGGFMNIQFVISADRVESMEVLSHTETPNIGTLAIEQVIPAMVEAQSSEVDGVSGATITSAALKDAWNQAIEQARLPEEEEAVSLVPEGAKYIPGTYDVKLRGMGGFMNIQFVISADRVESMEVLSHTETPNIGTLAIEQVIPAMVEAQSSEVDGVSGATITSAALKDAWNQAVKQATGN